MIHLFPQKCRYPELCSIGENIVTLKTSDFEPDFEEQLKMKSFSHDSYHPIENLREWSFYLQAMKVLCTNMTTNFWCLKWEMSVLCSNDDWQKIKSGWSVLFSHLPNIDYMRIRNLNLFFFVPGQLVSEMMTTKKVQSEDFTCYWRFEHACWKKACELIN